MNANGNGKRQMGRGISAAKITDHGANSPTYTTYRPHEKDQRYLR